MPSVPEFISSSVTPIGLAPVADPALAHDPLNFLVTANLQAGENWCWAATAEAINNYYCGRMRIDWPQCRFVRCTPRLPPDLGPLPGNGDVCGRVGDPERGYCLAVDRRCALPGTDVVGALPDALKLNDIGHYGRLEAYTVDNFAEFQAIHRTIAVEISQKKQPVCVRVAIDHPAGDFHIFVIYHVEYYQPDQPNYYIWNPANGYHYLPFSEMAWLGHWTDLVFTA